VNRAHLAHGLAVVLAALAALAAAPAGAATLEGEVVHTENPAAAANVSLSLLGVRRGGDTVERTARSDADGRFRFEDVPADAAYLLFGEYSGIRFYGGTTVLREQDADATRSLVLRIHERTDDPAGLALRSLAVGLEREAGRWRARTLARISNPTSRAIAIEDASPAPLRLGLLPGAGEPRTPFGRLPPGARVQDGAVELRGPFLPGEQELTLDYEIGEAGDALTAALVLPDPVESFELRVRDFGVAVDAGALHPARPVKDGDEVWMRWIGFDLPAGASLPLALEPLPPRRPLPRTAQALVVAFLAGALFLFVARPLSTARTRVGRDLPPEAAGEDPEREALFAALRDLEHDYETGKLSAEDRERMRAALRDEAVRELAARRGSEPAVAPAEPQVCECGRRTAPGDRFCAACGKPL
jgi:hypothetical protein